MIVNPYGINFPGAESPGTTITLPSAGAYSVTESGGPSGYTASSSAQCSGTAVVGGTYTCTITNDDQPGTLTVTKNLINDNGGTLACPDFVFQVDGGPSIPFEADCSNDVTVNAGNHTVTETAVSGYTTTYANCTAVAVTNGGSATCTITNNDIAPTLTVIKHVVNDNGGTATAGQWTMNVTATNPSANNFSGSESPGTTIMIDAGVLLGRRERRPQRLHRSSSAECSGTAVVGGTYTCTITNDDQAVTLHVIKHVINDNGGTRSRLTGR